MDFRARKMNLILAIPSPGITNFLCGAELPKEINRFKTANRTERFTAFNTGLQGSGLLMPLRTFRATGTRHDLKPETKMDRRSYGRISQKSSPQIFKGHWLSTASTLALHRGYGLEGGGVHSERNAAAKRSAYGSAEYNSTALARAKPPMVRIRSGSAFSATNASRSFTASPTGTTSAVFPGSR